ncbi:helix-turn-helix domain-containing protein [Variovorax sp. ZS18.2.2]|uniref:helix-turn-helix domain-containing protein n=1 Tax=Variovorax sp. ZS18.2.2 TaxID=2971255 RepID=UPI002151DF1D|nr:helix-turn-helix domain-containing protein [Variovorax sp. ZS18.2.2]MCR6476123.1 helix-turn-helix domain-containing protein [Variovorax sp. ZS18.2.2]
MRQVGLTEPMSVQAIVALVGHGDALSAAIRRRLDLMRHASVAFETMVDLAVASRAGQRFDLLVLVWPADATAEGLAMLCASVAVPMLVVVERQVCIELQERRIAVGGNVDFVTLPKDDGEFESGVWDMLARFGVGMVMPPKMDEVVCGDYRFRASQWTVVLPDGRTVHLKPLEFKLGLLLFCNQGRLLPRDWLWSALWHRAPRPGERSLDVCIAGVRRTLGLHAAGRGLVLRGIYKQGYRLDAVMAD